MNALGMTKIGFNKTVEEKRPNYGSTNATATSSKASESSVSVCIDDEERKVQRGSILLGFYIVLYACFLVAGAAIFASLEAPKELEVRGNLMRMRAEFLTRFPNVKGQS